MAEYIDIGVRIMAFLFGAFMICEGFGELVNLMGDHKTSRTAKCVGGIVMFAGVIVMVWVFT